MRSWCIGITLSLALGLPSLQGAAFAHGTEMHGKTAQSAVQMKKLHDMMPMFSVASARLEAALDKGDAAAAEAEAGKIMVALPDLKKSKPHKNVKERKKFVDLAIDFEKTVASTLDLAKKGDFAGAKTAFKKGEEICAACHAKFRD